MLPLLLLFTLTQASTWPDADFCEDLRRRANSMFGEAVREDATLIDDGLWLGNVCAASDNAFLGARGISHVINMAIEWAEQCSEDREGVKRYCFALDDVSTSDPVTTASIITLAANRVTELRAQNASVLVHCNMGVSRSAAVVIRHLMDRDPTLMYSEALARVRHLRPIARPNTLFGSLLETVKECKRRWKAKNGL